LWLNAISESGADPVFIFSLRHPIEVARSLARRDGIPEARSCLIWLRYMLEAELASRGYPRVVVSYDALLADWHAALAPLGSRLGLDISFVREDVAERIDAFLTPSLRHHTYDNVSACPAGPWFDLAEKVYRVFLEYADELPSEVFDEFRRKMDEMAGLVDPWASQIQALLLRTELLENELARVADRDILAAEVVRIKSTFSWQLTKPFRALRNGFLWLNTRNTRKTEDDVTQPDAD
jgi:hypothetical protein